MIGRGLVKIPRDLVMIGTDFVIEMGMVK
jgi:hypothetical protein